jgi:hypothetical protein
MARDLFFHVQGWAAWSPDRETESAWRAWVGSAAAPNSGPQPVVPAALRRRISPLGQAALRCAWGLPNASNARIVSASRHGEFGRTLSILDALATGDDVSPAEFTLSVHHALAGVLSIAQHNRRGHTAVAAGPESFGFGLMEAVAALTDQPNEPVLFVYYDEPLPAPYSDLDSTPEPPLALALSLASVGNGERFSLTVTPSAEKRTPSLSGFDFLRFMLTDAPGMIAHSERLQWHWGRYAAAA